MEEPQRKLKKKKNKTNGGAAKGGCAATAQKKTGQGEWRGVGSKNGLWGDSKQCKGSWERYLIWPKKNGRARENVVKVGHGSVGMHRGYIRPWKKGIGSNTVGPQKEILSQQTKKK